jgi:hypothetical protein
MLSKRTSGWKLHDWLFFIILLFVGSAIFFAAVNGFAPTSGLAKGLSEAGHHIAQFMTWIASFFLILASWFSSW